ncbi:FliM/FliN family flagellar motor switch protein [Sphingopyxis sp. SE2]|uniref:flagellar motor switch protein FliM n=1 Tax=Sphingopyxis sp. SE2 TaxID=1586240 RepID=UPI000510222E|nr:FliM/FliN family flagellar motor switch protein [Sphingopyxis sp. SE2]KGB52765.1 Surface presentation of antigens (SPOA) protein [Sphingopyxis sp. LC363]MDT7530421.1 FliM/FliN family flagellar motor switch protein [Sphingopyxis sp. SE2]
MTTGTKSVKAVKAPRASPPAPAAAPADSKESLLLRKAADSYAFPALEGVANQFARSLRDLIRALGAPAIQVERAGAEQMSFAEWSASAAPAIFWRYHAAPLKGPVLLAGSRSLLLQLVDIFYGGRGQLAAEREELTDAEDRFAARLGRDIGMQLAAAWRGKLALEPELDCVTADPAKLAAVRAEDELFVQRFTLRGAPFDGRVILCAYPVAALRGIAGDELLPDMPAAGGGDPVWSGALDKALRDVRMPVRSVLARPEISLVKLLALEVGDIIPLSMPRHVPVTVAGRSFAFGSIGEANGNAAIMIDHIEKGPDND